MAPDMVPLVWDGQHENKARDTLNRMSRYRVDPARIKTSDTTPRGRGGQGVVIVGTLACSGAPDIFLPERLDESLHRVLGGLISGRFEGVSLEALEELISDGPTELLTEAFKKLPSEALDVLHPEEMKKVVFEAFKAFGRKVAVKKLEWPRDDVAESTKFFKSFVNELSLMASISHPNIIEFLGFVEDTEKADAWIILAWESNGNVREFLQSGQWDIPERISLITDVANGLEYLHSHDPPICHGDLKSLNILVNSSHRAVITDFGSARIRQSVPAKQEENHWEMPHQVLDLVGDDMAPQVKFDPSTSDLTLAGPRFSLRWTAPEVLDNGMQDLPSDMWAMGWVCWEIITGRIPFEQLHYEAIIIKHTLDGKLPAIRQDIGFSHILKLCTMMSDCWLSEPDKRIDASVFRRKISIMPSSTPSGSTSDGQKVRSADLLVSLGDMYESQSDKANAKACYLSAIDIATRTKDDLAKANALRGLGGIHFANSNFEEAEISYKQAQDIYCRLRNSLGTANTLVGLGEIHNTQSKHRDAEKAFTDAHEIYSRIGNDLGTGSALFGLGNAYRAQSRNQEAEKAFMEALETHSRTGDDVGAAGALTGLGNTYLIQLKNQEAEMAFNESYKILSRIGDDRGAAKALLGLGKVHSTQSKHREAEKAFNDVYEICSRIGDDSGIGYALVGLGHIYGAQSRYREAEKAFMEAREAYSLIDDDWGAGFALIGLGMTYGEQSRNQEAETAFMKAHEIHSRTGNNSTAAHAAHQLVQIYRTQSKIQEAEKAFVDARKIHSPNGNHLQAGTAPHHLGMLYSDQCKYNEAELSYRQALASYDRANDGDSSARTRLALGYLYHTQHRYLEAEEATTEALAIWISLGNEKGQADASVLLSIIFGSQSKDTEAIDGLIRAEEAYARIGEDRARATTWYLVGNTQLAQGMHTEAAESYRLAQAIFLSLGHTRGEATVLGSLGGLYAWRLYLLPEAEECFAQARLLFAAIPDEKREAEALDGLMAAQALQNKFGDLERACMEACQIYKRIGQPISAICANTLGLLQDLQEMAFGPL